MLERILVHKQALVLFFTLSDEDDDVPLIEPIVVAEWKLIAELVELLSPLASVTESMSASKFPSLSLMIPIITGVNVQLRKVKPTNDDVTKVKQAL